MRRKILLIILTIILGSIFLVENTINTRAASGSIELTIFSSGSWNSSFIWSRTFVFNV